MRIIALRTVPVEIPGTTWIVKPETRSFGCVLVFVETDEEITGESFLWTFGTERLDVLNRLVLSLKDELVGEDPHCTGRIWGKLWDQLRFFGDRGISVFGISAIDRACWDASAKAAGKPLYKLLGACRDEIPVYASGLWLHLTLEELANDAAAFLSQGYRAIKMRIGKGRIEEDLERVRAVRAVIGPEVDLMVDANQRFTVDHAVRLGRKLEELDIAWLEEPVPAYDLEGSAQVAAALDLPVAGGENIFPRYGFRDMLATRAADIWMPDMVCAGGVTEMMKVAHMAEAYGIAITPHIFAEESMHVVAAIPNGTYVERIDWFTDLYEERIEMRNGQVVLPERPGFGFTFNRETIERYRIADKA